MTVAKLVAGQRGIDYSYSRPSLASAYKTGGRFVVRYSAGAASAPSHPSHGANAGKLISPAEHAAILAAGQDVIANDEWYESRITERVEHPTAGLQPLKGLEGLMFAARLDLGQKLPADHDDMLTYVSSAARADALAARALWKACGHAHGASIYVSWDAAPVKTKWPAVDAYLDTYESTLGGVYHVDCYAGTPYLKHAKADKLIRFGWRPNAGSWSSDGLPYQPDTGTAARRQVLVANALKATPAHIWQTGNYWFAKNADENLIVVAAVGSHQQAIGAPAPAPAPTPAPAPVLVTGRNPAVIIVSIDKATVPSGTKWPGVFSWDGQQLRHVHAPEGKVNNEAALLAACGQKAPATIGYGQFVEWGGATK